MNKDKLAGVIQSGFGRGRKFIEKKNYFNQIKKKLGFSPYLGTLNIETNINNKNKFLLSSIPILLTGYSENNKTFGDVTAYQINIRIEDDNVEGALVAPKSTSHDKSIIEVISQVYLRKKYSLKDGDKIIITKRVGL